MARKPSANPVLRCGALIFRVCGMGWICFVAGCGSMRSAHKAENIIRSRELACRGMDASEQGRHHEAEQIFSKAIEMSPADERARQHYAEALWKRGEMDEAIVQMRESAKLSGGCPDLVVRLGEMYLAAGKPEFASQSAERALKVNCKLGSAWSLKGNIARSRGQLDEALACYHRSMAYDENNVGLQIATAEVYRELQRSERSLATLQSLRERLSPGEETSGMLHLEGLVLRDLGRFDPATECLSAAIGKGNPTSQMYIDLAETQLMANRPERAEAAIASALSIDPNHAASLEIMNRARAQRERMSALVDRAASGMQ